VNPDKQECFGLYLFGAGYYADEDESRKATIGDETHFCQRCLRAPECMDDLRGRVKHDRPDLVDEYDQLMKAAERRGVPELTASYHLSRIGKHPYATKSSSNFSLGRTQRRREKRQRGEVRSSAG
jgi:hypothetical protein